MMTTRGSTHPRIPFSGAPYPSLSTRVLWEEDLLQARSKTIFNRLHKYDVVVNLLKWEFVQDEVPTLHRGECNNHPELPGNQISKTTAPFRRYA